MTTSASVLAGALLRGERGDPCIFFCPELERIDRFNFGNRSSRTAFVEQQQVKALARTNAMVVAALGQTSRLRSRSALYSTALQPSHLAHSPSGTLPLAVAALRA